MTGAIETSKRRRAMGSHQSTGMHSDTWLTPPDLWQSSDPSILIRAARRKCHGARRLHFHYPAGRRAAANAGAPSMLAAYGWRDADVLAGCAIDGQFVPLLPPRSVVALALPGRWRDEVLSWLPGGAPIPAQPRRGAGPENLIKPDFSEVLTC
jgi:hypothetical protein